MSESVDVQNSPCPLDVEKGKSYWWCTCGKSANLPFCDGTHKGSDFVPLEFKAEESKTVHFCRCGRSANLPLCDGTHSKA